MKKGSALVPVMAIYWSEGASHCSAARGLLVTHHVILNDGQGTWTKPELAPPLLTTTPHPREDVSALDRFNVHRCPTRRVFSGTGIELVTMQATIRYLYHSATAAYCCNSTCSTVCRRVTLVCEITRSISNRERMEYHWMTTPVLFTASTGRLSVDTTSTTSMELHTTK
ncbi:uncharacterized protein TNCV_4588361 [Trichonephila clavipes]|nr:uncharacterized protein TNCV_4588361 [Trichonephila clavipes]